ncbi:MAG TPA: hypothetical protein VFE58_17250 [Tepidisphaeraceae bacterium]|jgi:hypothetical protein|nr:hypothetical protein [Tepidisphaeraceae bacterium]
MTCRGHILNGSIMLDTPTNLPEGTEVEVNITPLQHIPPTDREETLRKLANTINYDFDAIDRLREASKL